MASCPGRIEEFSALLDGELEPEEELDLRQHLDACATCRAWRAELESLSRAIASSIGRERAPRPLVQRVGRLRVASSRRRMAGAGAIAAMALAALALWGLPPGREGTAAVLIEDHRRFVSGMRTLAVPSSDPDEVARRLAARLPFRVAVTEVKGARLRGGHDCSFPDGPAAYLQYETGGEIVSVYVAPALNLPTGSERKPCQTTSGTTLCAFVGSEGAVAVLAGRPETARTFREAAGIVRSP